MAEPSRHAGDHHFIGDITYGGSVSLPSGTVDNDDVATSSTNPIQATKLESQRSVTLDYNTVQDSTNMIHVARSAGTFVSLEAFVHVPPTTGNVRIDLQKSTSGTTFASIMTTSGIAITTTNTSNSVVVDTVANATMHDGDAFRVVCFTSGTTGQHGTGWGVTATWREQQ